MAETYGVFDWRQLPLVTAATLAQGLPSTSRTARQLSGCRIDNRTALLAIIADRIGHIAWMFSQDGQAGKNYPPSLLELLTDSQETDSGFENEEDFLAAWAAITGGETNV